MGNFITRKNHPQPTLIPFYQSSLVYLIYETTVGVLWTAHMLILKFTLDRLDGVQYRAFNESNLFHFTAAISMWAVVQQTANDNSVSWWAFVPLFVSFANDVSGLLSIIKGFLGNEIAWAWNFALAQTICQLIGTLFAIIIYTTVFLIIKPRDLPNPVAFRKGKLRKGDLEEPLVNYKKL